MNEHQITCPKCGHEFPLSEAVSLRIEERLKADYERQRREKEAELAEERKAVEEQATLLQTKLDNVELDIQQKVKEKEQLMLEHVRKKVAEEHELKVKDMQSELNEAKGKLKETQAQELNLRKRQRELEEEKQNIDLELERRLAEEKKAIEVNLQKRLADDYTLKIAEKDKTIDDLRRKTEELQQAASVGSQQLQGEIAELEFERVLPAKFPFDRVEPVPKGTPGADLIQTVRDELGAECGSIVWEIKRTKNWSDGWIQKLKDDQANIKGNIGIIATQALPKDVSGFAFYQGIWVTDFSSALGLATALRAGLIEVNLAQTASIGKNEKVEAIYQYLTGPNFRQRVGGIVDAFQSMKGDLDTEKRVIQKQWAKREKQIERTIAYTTGLYGDLQAIVGGAFPQIQELELEQLEQLPEPEEPEGKPKGQPPANNELPL